MFYSYAIDDIGSDNFVVSRLRIELTQIISLYDIDETTKKSIVDAVHDIAKQIIFCEKTFSRIHSEVYAIQAEIDTGKYLDKQSGMLNDMPFIIDLDKSCEDFLYRAKLALREIICILEKIYGVTLKARNFDKLVKILQTEHIENDELFILMETCNKQWIKCIVEMRNYVEHTSDAEIDRKLIITNYEFDSASKQFLPPIWEFYLKDQCLLKEYVFKSMDFFISNLVLFAENVVLTAIDKKYDLVFPYKEREINYSGNRDLKRFDYL